MAYVFTYVFQADAAKKEGGQQRPHQQRLHKIAGNAVLHRKKKKEKKRARFVTYATSGKNPS